MLWKGSQPTSCCLIGSSEIGNISFNLHCLKLESVFCFHIAEAFIKVNAMSDWMVRGWLFFPSVEDWRITTEDHSSEEEWRIIMKLPTARRFRINKWRWFLMPRVAKLQQHAGKDFYRCLGWYQHQFKRLLNRFRKGSGSVPSSGNPCTSDGRHAGHHCTQRTGSGLSLQPSCTNAVAAASRNTSAGEGGERHEPAWSWPQAASSTARVCSLHVGSHIKVKNARTYRDVIETSGENMKSTTL